MWVGATKGLVRTELARCRLGRYWLCVSYRIQGFTSMAIPMFLKEWMALIHPGPSGLNGIGISDEDKGL